MIELTGKLQAQGLRFGIVVARFNDMITKNLLEGALEALSRLGAEDELITVAWVPGSYEIPVIAKEMASSGNYDAIICLGAVIRGTTAHFDYVAGEAGSGIGQVARETGVPIIFGVLTTNTLEQAIERAGTKCGNKGYEWAFAAVEMADLIRQLRNPLKHDETGSGSSYRANKSYFVHK